MHFYDTVACRYSVDIHVSINQFIRSQKCLRGTTDTIALPRVLCFALTWIVDGIIYSRLELYSRFRVYFVGRPKGSIKYGVPTSLDVDTACSAVRKAPFSVYGSLVVIVVC